MKIINVYRKIVWLSILLILGIVLVPNISSASQDKICSVYFTYIGCPNCAHTDPIVLTEWTEKYPDLVVIEYAWKGGDFGNPNSKFFGKYSREYGTQPAVPYLAITKKNIRIGRNSVPKAEDDIKSLKSNPSLLKNGSVAFEKLNLNQLKAKPKIWANGRILIKEDKDTWIFQWNGKALSSKLSGEKIASSDLLKELLFTENLSTSLDGINFEIIEPRKAKFSGTAFPERREFVPYKEFDKAIKISLSDNSSSQSTISSDNQNSQENEGKSEKQRKEIGWEIPVILGGVALAVFLVWFIRFKKNKKVDKNE